MNPLTSYTLSRSSDHPCPDLATMAERELSAFFHAIQKLFGPVQAEISADDWLQELSAAAAPPASIREWRTITARAASRLALRLGAHTPELQVA